MEELMRIAVFGTGVVGKTVAGKLDELGHEVAVGTRDPDATKARTEPGQFGEPSYADFLATHPKVKTETYAVAARDAEIVVNATSGAGAIEALKSAGALAGTLIMDISNPLDFSKGFPPRLTVCNDDSLGEQIQRAFPEAKVVKTLNTVNAFLMVAPAQLAGGDHTMFVCGNDGDAKQKVTTLLTEGFGWRDVLDLGDITNARGTEMLLPIWTRIYASTKNPMFGFKVVR
jgi:hypothetical protein